MSVPGKVDISKATEPSNSHRDLCREQDICSNRETVTSAHV